MTILACGEYERVKAGVHGVALGLFAVMAIYNAAAWLDREESEPHLAFNALLYWTLGAFELRQVARHLDRG